MANIICGVEQNFGRKCGWKKCISESTRPDYLFHREHECLMVAVDQQLHLCPIHNLVPMLCNRNFVSKVHNPMAPILHQT